MPIKGVQPETQGRVAYARRRKRDRPLCPRCQTPFRALTAVGRFTYYYPRCDCPVDPVKVQREILTAQIKDEPHGLPTSPAD